MGDLPSGDIRSGGSDNGRQIRQETKFIATDWYVGSDTPEDGRALTQLVNRAIDDVISLPPPYGSAQLRGRMQKLITDVDLFATEDREQVYRYVVRIWRAAGFAEESKLFAVSDDRVLRQPSTPAQQSRTRR
jgi:hypothetical protein